MSVASALSCSICGIRFRRNRQIQKPKSAICNLRSEIKGQLLHRQTRRRILGLPPQILRSTAIPQIASPIHHSVQALSLRCRLSMSHSRKQEHLRSFPRLVLDLLPPLRPLLRASHGPRPPLPRSKGILMKLPKLTTLKSLPGPFMVALAFPRPRFAQRTTTSFGAANIHCGQQTCGGPTSGSQFRGLPSFFSATSSQPLSNSAPSAVHTGHSVRPSTAGAHKITTPVGRAAQTSRTSLPLTQSEHRYQQVENT